MAAVLGLLAPPVAAGTVAPASAVERPAAAIPRAAPTPLRSDGDWVCAEIGKRRWIDVAADGKPILKKVISTVADRLVALHSPELQGIGKAFGLGGVYLLEHAQANCSTETLAKTVQALPFLSLTPRTQLYPDRNQYSQALQNSVSAADAAQQFIAAGARQDQMTAERVRELATALCTEATQPGAPQTNLADYIQAADLRAAGAVKTVMSLTLEGCAQLTGTQADYLTARLNNQLISNDTVKNLPPTIVGLTATCGNTPDQIVLSWKLFAFATVPETGYALYLRPVGGQWTQLQVHLDPATGNSTFIAPLQQTTYDFALSATDDRGNQSAWTYLTANAAVCRR
ncbi:hypothetical protein [Streptomyces sp. NBC_00648]|uniref:hypothetical protein n=1 Tax=Streptomyces sp. NBC_00648 TaxID=2975797 RepID=UPI003254173F